MADDLEVTIARIEELLKKATPGPWEVRFGSLSEKDSYVAEKSGVCLWDDRGSMDRFEDAQYIASVSPSVIQQMIEKLRTLEKERDEARDALHILALKYEASQQYCRRVAMNAWQVFGALWGINQDAEQARISNWFYAVAQGKEPGELFPLNFPKQENGHKGKVSSPESIRNDVSEARSDTEERIEVPADPDPTRWQAGISDERRIELLCAELKKVREERDAALERRESGSGEWVAQEHFDNLKASYEGLLNALASTEKLVDDLVEGLRGCVEALDEEIGVSFDCECGRTEYNDSPECQECGRERPAANTSLFKATALLSRVKGGVE